MEVTALQTMKAVRCTSATPMVTQMRELHRSFKGPPKKSNKNKMAKDKLTKSATESPFQKLLSTTQYRSYPPPSSPPERQWCPPETRGLSGMPIFKRAALFRKNVAICDTDGSFIYEDIYHRYAYFILMVQ